MDDLGYDADRERGPNKRVNDDFRSGFYEEDTELPEGLDDQPVEPESNDASYLIGSITPKDFKDHSDKVKISRGDVVHHLYNSGLISEGIDPAALDGEFEIEYEDGQVKVGYSIEHASDFEEDGYDERRENQELHVNFKDKKIEVEARHDLRNEDIPERVTSLISRLEQSNLEDLLEK